MTCAEGCACKGPGRHPPQYTQPHRWTPLPSTLVQILLDTDTSTHPSALPTHTYMHTHTPVQINPDVDTHLHTQPHSQSTCTEMHMPLYTESNIHTHTCAHTFGYRHMSIHPYICTLHAHPAHPHLYRHTQTSIYTHWNITQL